MKTLLTILLITNLFTSCGKKNETGNRPQNEFKKVETIPQESSKEEKEEKEIGQEPPTLKTVDKPLSISKLDNLNDLITIKINGKEYDLHQTLADMNKVSSYIKNSLKNSAQVKKHIRYQYYVKLNNDLFSYAVNSMLNIEVISKSGETVPSLSFSNNFSDTISTLKKQGSYLPRDLFNEKKIYLRVDKESFIIEKNTYTLTINGVDSLLSYKVPTEFSIKDALLFLNRSDLIEAFEFSQSIYKTNTFTNIENDFNFWILLNAKSQKLESFPSLGDEITLTKFTKSNLAKRFKLPVINKTFKNKDGDYIFSKDNITSFSIKISGVQQVFSNSKKEGSKDLPNGQFNSLGVNVCLFIDNLINTKDIKLDSNKAFNYFIGKNKNKVSYSEIKNKIFTKSEKLQLIIKPSRTFLQSVKTGLSKFPMEGCSCIKHDKINYVEKSRVIRAKFEINYNQI